MVDDPLSVRGGTETLNSSKGDSWESFPLSHFPLDRSFSWRCRLGFRAKDATTYHEEPHAALVSRVHGKLFFYPRVDGTPSHYCKYMFLTDYGGNVGPVRS